MDAALEEKTTFFDLLKSPKSEDEFDEAEREERVRQKRFFAAKTSPASVVDAENQSTRDAGEQMARKTPRKVASVPTPASKADSKVIRGTPVTALAQKGKLGALLNGGDDEVIIVGETPIPNSIRPVTGRSQNTPLLSLKRRSNIANDNTHSPSLATKKRKKEASIKMRPEGEQIFKGLSFYYVPDNDIAPARRLRITKAREYGATWTRDPASATHIVAEKNIRFQDVGGILARANQTQPPIVVNEEYPLDCIQFKTPLQHNQKKYQLAGQPSIGSNELSKLAPPSLADSDKSLQLKPPPNNPKRWDYVPPGGTPSRSEQSSQRSRVVGTPPVLDSQPVVLDILQTVESPREAASDGETASKTEVVDDGRAKGSNHQWVDENQNAMTGSERSHQQAAQRCDHDGDELSEYIAIMQEYKNLPIDVEEEDDTKTAMDVTEVHSDSNEGTGSEDDQKRRRRSSRRTVQGSRKDMAFEDRFACNSAGPKDAKAGNPNTRTMEVLQRMADYYNRINDHWRTTAYRKAIATLKRQETKITTEEQAFRLPSVGRRLAQKIEEIVTTDRLQRLEYAEGEPMDDTLQLFLQIYGVGNTQAHQWIAQGFRTLDDLKERAKLTPNQLTGIEHYDDLNTRIPRREIEALGALVCEAAAKIDPAVQCIIGGSYRRGATSSGDIDFIITKPNTETSSELRPFLDDLVRKLEATKFLVARLASSRSANDGSKWHGCCVLPKIKGFNEEDYRPVWRRIDFLLVPEAEIGAALLYFTGNDIFNRSMRLLASKKGMRLNQRGLYKDVLRGPQREKVTQGELVEGRDERRIFDILGVKWREPHERWC